MGLINVLFEDAKQRLVSAEDEFNNADSEHIDKAVEKLNKAKTRVNLVLELAKTM